MIGFVAYLGTWQQSNQTDQVYPRQRRVTGDPSAARVNQPYLTGKSHEHHALIAPCINASLLTLPFSITPHIWHKTAVRALCHLLSRRAVVSCTGTAPLPSSGNSVDMPHYAQIFSAKRRRSRAELVINKFDLQWDFANSIRYLSDQNVFE